MQMVNYRFTRIDSGGGRWVVKRWNCCRTGSFQGRFSSRFIEFVEPKKRNTSAIGTKPKQRDARRRGQRRKIDLDALLLLLLPGRPRFLPPNCSRNGEPSSRRPLGEIGRRGSTEHQTATATKTTPFFRTAARLSLLTRRTRPWRPPWPPVGARVFDVAFRVENSRRTPWQSSAGATDDTGDGKVLWNNDRKESAVSEFVLTWLLQRRCAPTLRRIATVSAQSDGLPSPTGGGVATSKYFQLDFPIRWKTKQTKNQHPNLHRTIASVLERASLESTIVFRGWFGIAKYFHLLRLEIPFFGPRLKPSDVQGSYLECTG